MSKRVTLNFKQRMHLANVLSDIAGEHGVLSFASMQALHEKVMTHVDEDMIEEVSHGNLRSLVKEMDLTLDLSNSQTSLFKTAKRVEDLETNVLRLMEHVNGMHQLLVKVAQSSGTDRGLKMLVTEYLSKHGDSSNAMVAAMKKAVTVS